jgi:hypothetical protein
MLETLRSILCRMLLALFFCYRPLFFRFAKRDPRLLTATFFRFTALPNPVVHTKALSRQVNGISWWAARKTTTEFTDSNTLPKCRTQQHYHFRGFPVRMPLTMVPTVPSDLACMHVTPPHLSELAVAFFLDRYQNKSKALQSLPGRSADYDDNSNGPFLTLSRHSNCTGRSAAGCDH